MAVSEPDRHELYQKLEEAIGKKATETMMSLLRPTGWADVATKRDLQALEEKLQVKMEAMESRLNERITATALKVNIPSIVAAVALAFTAARLG